ncbi:MAG TPA: GntR family transcriptional regulator [Bryobacteraceae bacterium]|nr:GntR family transcriptional regulator [Bryobacteraceae bacterium]
MADAIVEIPSQTLKTHVVERIKDGIISGRYKPGDRLNETHLARDFGVSRIPVREALLQLQEQGLVMNSPRRGMFVNSLTEEDTQRINSVRIILEAEAIKLCRSLLTPKIASELNALVVQMENWESGSQLDASVLDLEFHRSVWRHSGNSYLEKTLHSMLPVLFAHRALDAISDELQRWRLNHHRSLLDVIEGNSRQTPEEAIVTHLRMGYNNPERFSSLGLPSGNAGRFT